MQTRRSFMSILLSIIPASLLVGKIAAKDECSICNRPMPHTVEELDAEAAAFKQYYDETEINAKPISVGPFYDQYVETKTGELVDGNEIRLFLDWSPLHPELPRWFRVKYYPLPLTSNQHPRGYRAVMTTYLDSELKPVYKEYAPTLEEAIRGKMFLKNLQRKWHQ